jgi:hypothetical protein
MDVARKRASTAGRTASSRFPTSTSANAKTEKNKQENDSTPSQIPALHLDMGTVGVPDRFTRYGASPGRVATSGKTRKPRQPEGTLRPSRNLRPRSRSAWPAQRERRVGHRARGGRSRLQRSRERPNFHIYRIPCLVWSHITEIVEWRGGHLGGAPPKRPRRPPRNRRGAHARSPPPALCQCVI